MILSSVIYDNVKMECVQEKNLVRWSTSEVGSGSNDEQFYELRLNNAETFERFYARFKDDISTAAAIMGSKQGVKSSDAVSLQVSLKDDGPLAQQLLKEKVDFDTVVFKQTESNATQPHLGNLPVEPAEDDDLSKANPHQENTGIQQQCSEEVDDSVLPMASTQSNYTRANFATDFFDSRDLSDLQQVCIHIMHTY